jgi:endonuclease YncB( thermonuclease family)
MLILAAYLAASGASFACTPVRVWDGDGPIWCAEGPRVRLAGIAAREIDGSCRRYHPCPRASGIEARDRLVALLGGAVGRSRSGHIIVRGPLLTCQSVGRTYRRIAARCSARHVGDLGSALVRAGVALKWDEPHGRR